MPRLVVDLALHGGEAGRIAGQAFEPLGLPLGEDPAGLGGDLRRRCRGATLRRRRLPLRSRCAMAASSESRCTSIAGPLQVRPRSLLLLVKDARYVSRRCTAVAASWDQAPGLVPRDAGPVGTIAKATGLRSAGLREQNRDERRISQARLLPPSLALPRSTSRRYPGNASVQHPWRSYSSRGTIAAVALGSLGPGEAFPVGRRPSRTRPPGPIAIL